MIICLILALLWSLKMSVHFFLFSGSRSFHLVCLEIFNQLGAKDTTLCSMDQKTMCGQEVNKHTVVLGTIFQHLQPPRAGQPTCSAPFAQVPLHCHLPSSTPGSCPACSLEGSYFGLIPSSISKGRMSAPFSSHTDFMTQHQGSPVMLLSCSSDGTSWNPEEGPKFSLESVPTIGVLDAMNWTFFPFASFLTGYSSFHY